MALQLAEELVEPGVGAAERLGADVLDDMPAPFGQVLDAATHAAFVGLLSGDTGLPPIDPRLLFTSGAVVRGIAVGSRAQFLAMNRAIEANRLTPVIDRVFPFDEAVEATATTRPSSRSARS